MDDLAEEGDGSEDEDKASPKDEKKPPIVQLAAAVQTGMQAIAASMAQNAAISWTLS
ncbi:hypothetical protein PR003_g20657 [Phytophthora rubi]|uniref:Uncharacterized protein n=2 Tax=Phytophthora TaxID=4783 RepID=A0A6A3JY71_9STRA|nr:hypothetical protein PR002_g19800 [Phytophthora rubi]KAE9000230.1 hypothetical protein PR001_g18841 [Phytophthora rubi]KAE9308805.1 hypothetical protein PR003_g20657 [Phytophthora rubi]KAE9310127.1 hypothetical protein PF008_g20531 [Phytophthora fragariae]